MEQQHRDQVSSSSPGRTQVEGGARRAHALSGLTLAGRAERGHLDPVGSRLPQLREELVGVLVHAGALAQVPCRGKEGGAQEVGGGVTPAFSYRLCRCRR